MCADSRNFPGVMALMASIMNNTHSASRLKFHLVLTEATKESFRHYLRCFPAFPPDVPLEVIQLETNLLAGKIHVPAKHEVFGNLSSLANFARFFVHDLFPAVKKALYLDTDIIVKGDVADLWEQLEVSEELLLAVPRYVYYTTVKPPKKGPSSSEGTKSRI
jgi:lipopolysaccharide biosynthesis glycosyltransferase